MRKRTYGMLNKGKVVDYVASSVQSAERHSSEPPSALFPSSNDFGLPFSHVRFLASRFAVNLTCHGPHSRAISLAQYQGEFRPM